jgi:hypothetical protein
MSKFFEREWKKEIPKGREKSNSLRAAQGGKFVSYTDYPIGKFTAAGSKFPKGAQ